MNFQEKLDKAIDKNNSLLCVGPDPDISKLPPKFKNSSQPLFEFNKEIIDATADSVCAFKPNSAFYEAHGANGIEQLKATCDYIKKNYSDIPIIFDAKRGDIGNTNKGYAAFAFDYLGADAITLQPYQGIDSLGAFLEYGEKGKFIWVKSSNPDGGEFQNLTSDSKPFYEHVAEAVQKRNVNGNVLTIVGATYPEELSKIRSIVGESNILVPGIGAQGGDLGASLRAGLNSKKRGLIISTSRSVIYASNDDDFAQSARAEAEKIKNQINQHR